MVGGPGGQQLRAMAPRVFRAAYGFASSECDRGGPGLRAPSLCGQLWWGPVLPLLSAPWTQFVVPWSRELEFGWTHPSPRWGLGRQGPALDKGRAVASAGQRTVCRVGKDTCVSRAS